MKHSFIRTLLFLLVSISLESCSKDKIQFGLYPVKSGDKWGYVDKTGKYIINPQFEDADFFSNNLAAVGIKGDNEELLYGYIDKNGKYVINPQYKQISRFSEDIAWVIKDGCAPTAINNDGKELFTLEDVDAVWPYSEGLASFVIENDGKVKYGYIDKEGNKVIPATYSEAYPFSNGYALVKNQKDKYGFINKKGILILEYKFDDAIYCGNNGLICVRLGEKWGVVNESGKYIINPQFNEIMPDGDLFRIKVNDKYGWCDNTGKTIINPQFDQALIFDSNELAPACIGEKWGYINREGKWTINPQFNEASIFVGNLAQIKAEGGYGLVDEKGKYIVNPQFESMYLYKPYFFDSGLFKPINSDYYNVNKLVTEIKNRLKDGKIDGLKINTTTISEILKKYSVNPDKSDNFLIPLFTESDASVTLAVFGNFQKTVNEYYYGYSFPNNVFNPSALPKLYGIYIDLSFGKAKNKGKITFDALKKYLGGDFGKKNGINFKLKGDISSVSLIFSESDLNYLVAGFSDTGRILPPINNAAELAAQQADSIRIADSIAAAEAEAAAAAAASNY